MQIQAKHIAFFGKLAKPLLAAQSLTAVQLAKKTEDWSVLKETGALIAPGWSEPSKLKPTKSLLNEYHVRRQCCPAGQKT